MRAQRAAILLLLCAAAAGCGERAPSNRSAGGSTTPPYVRDDSDPSLLNEAMAAVRVGDVGPNFAACNARGATRDRVTPDAVAVRAAPYERADEIAQLAAGSEFFICTRSHDQRWFGIVYDEGGRATARCGVSGPVVPPRNYQGPCASGWVPSARVRLISGVPHSLPPETVPGVPAGEPAVPPALPPTP